MEGQFKKIAIGSITAIAIFVVGVGIIASYRRGGVVVPQSQPTIIEAGGGHSVTLTRGPVPPGTTVPDSGSKASEGVAIPSKVLRFKTYDARTFDLSIGTENFSSDAIIVWKGDTVELKISALDIDYDLYQPDYGLRQLVRKGETKSMLFGAADAGAYTLYCERCGGPDRGPLLSIIVVER